MRWYLALQPYKFQIQYHQGGQNANTDFFQLVWATLDLQGNLEGGGGCKPPPIYQPPQDESTPPPPKDNDRLTLFQGHTHSLVRPPKLTLYLRH